MLIFSGVVQVLNNINLQTAWMPIGSGQDADKLVYIGEEMLKAK